MNLQGAVAFVTGASAGIGKSIAVALHAAGASVWLGARRIERMSPTVEQLGARAAAGALDVTAEASRHAWLQAGERQLGAPTIFINNAGLALGRDQAHVVTVSDQATMLDTNVMGALELNRLVLQGMRARNRGDLLMIGSVAGLEPYAGGAIYCASKAAVAAYMRAVRAEVTGTNVRAILLEPGLVETEFSLVRTGGDEAKASAVYAGLQAMSADDIADCALFALTRPRHMNIDTMLMTATAQDGTRSVVRSG
jgi:3-hydroxy acid dehydrogenase / malonic semialdehyde reductase